MRSRLRRLWCAVREHPYDKNVEYDGRDYTFTGRMVRIETCSNCGTSAQGFVGEPFQL